MGRRSWPWLGSHPRWVKNISKLFVILFNRWNSAVGGGPKASRFGQRIQCQRLQSLSYYLKSGNIWRRRPHRFRRQVFQGWHVFNTLAKLHQWLIVLPSGFRFCTCLVIRLEVSAWLEMESLSQATHFIRYLQNAGRSSSQNLYFKPFFVDRSRAHWLVSWQFGI